MGTTPRGAYFKTVASLFFNFFEEAIFTRHGFCDFPQRTLSGNSVVAYSFYPFRRPAPLRFSLPCFFLIPFFSSSLLPCPSLSLLFSPSLSCVKPLFFLSFSNFYSWKNALLPTREEAIFLRPQLWKNDFPPFSDRLQIYFKIIKYFF